MALPPKKKDFCAFISLRVHKNTLFEWIFDQIIFKKKHY
jgi:hypothetical protein